MPRVRANTLVDPPGSTPSAVVVPATPVATSFSVPSPPNPMTTSTPRRAASWANRVAWPRRLVSTISTSWRWLSSRCTTTVLRAVTELANALTTSRIRKVRTLPLVGGLAVTPSWVP